MAKSSKIKVAPRQEFNFHKIAVSFWDQFSGPFWQRFRAVFFDAFRGLAAGTVLDGLPRGLKSRPRGPKTIPGAVRAIPESFDEPPGRLQDPPKRLLPPPGRAPKLPKRHRKVSKMLRERSQSPQSQGPTISRRPARPIRTKGGYQRGFPNRWGRGGVNHFP